MSEAVGNVHVTTATLTPTSLFWEIAAGVFVITGFSVSVTITSKLLVVLFPELSVAVYDTVVVPTGNVSPELCVLTNVATVALSEAVGAVQVITAPQRPVSLFLAIPEGVSEITGF